MKHYIIGQDQLDIVIGSLNTAKMPWTANELAALKPIERLSDKEIADCFIKAATNSLSAVQWQFAEAIMDKIGVPK